MKNITKVTLVSSEWALKFAHDGQTRTVFSEQSAPGVQFLMEGPLVYITWHGETQAVPFSACKLGIDTASKIDTKAQKKT